jgi:hypothetical protein
LPRKKGQHRARARALYAFVLLVALVSASFTAIANNGPHGGRNPTRWTA